MFSSEYVSIMYPVYIYFIDKTKNEDNYASTALILEHKFVPLAMIAMPA